MEPVRPRSNYTNIIAACIVTAGMLGAARIITQHSAIAPDAASAPPPLSAPTLPSPPITQESVKKQIRDQVLAAPSLQILRHNGTAYKLTDATVSQVSYSAKDDSFLAIVEWQWQPTMPADVPHEDYVSLDNNGYNQYIGTAGMRTVYANNELSARITIK